MPVVSVYSEGSFAVYLTDVLDTLAGVLGWDDSDPRVREAVTDALLEYGTSTISSITGGSNLLKLRALGRRAIWRAVAASTAGNYSFSSDGQRFDRHQVNEQAIKMIDQAEHECRSLGADTAYSAVILAVSRPQDPYAVLSDAERVLP